ncbi:hypothetical protein DB30_02826 [Enhygromyxa salina]|uniref:Uncharacterized protein n=1 Tax=Enhygromyxa salina TaxID=215803 RepID=A0A0C2A343_9BACT|nr:hypothetical protein DB30_02826 [Enhygromyxa salina]
MARAHPRELDGPCGSHVDLEIWNHELFALCADGRSFAIAEPGDHQSPPADAWRELPVRDASFVAFQRSDAMLLGVTSEAELHVLASHSDVAAEHAATLDRFRGPERGGPEQLGLATFIAFEPFSAHTVGLRRGPELVVSSPQAMLSCAIRARDSIVTDLTLPAYDEAVAATLVDRRGRTSIIHVHRDPNGRAFAGAFGPRGGRRLHPWVRCRQL